MPRSSATYENCDRIFLIGFGRDAYTVHTLADVISYCGVPRQLPARLSRARCCRLPQAPRACREGRLSVLLVL
ncbi:phospholipase effector Tle1 domain-containing protein [Bradyrhizobium sp. USDA 4503]